MKRVILITLFCFFYITNGVSQSYFNNRYDFYSENNASTNFIFVNDTFYLPVQFFTVGKSTIGKISKDGGLLLCNRYAASFAGSYYFSNAITQYENKIYTTGNGGYFNKISSPIYKYKLNGDTLKTNYFGDTAYYFLMQKIIVKTNEKNKILLIGVTDSTCGPGHQGFNKPVIRVVDTNGILHQSIIGFHP